MRRMLALAIVLVAVLPARAADAHVEGTGRPVVFLSSSSDCATTFGRMKAAVGRFEIEQDGEKHGFAELASVAAGAKGPGCDDGAGAASQDTPEIARAFAAWASSRYGSGAFDVVAEGKSGLGVRYALAHSGEEGWPKLNVEDAVTVGTPHDQLTDPGTDHPEGTQGTDWSVIGSDADTTAPGDSAIAMKADHKTTYKAPGLTHQALLDDDSAALDARIVYSHGNGDPVTWNKAPHVAGRVANELVYGVDSCGASNCTDSCAQEVAGWRLTWTCPNRGDLDQGVRNVSVTTPSGTQIDVPKISDYAIPVATTRRLLLPIVLPDLSFSAGGFAVTAYENSVDDDGLSIGTAGIVVPRAGEALAHDLKVNAKGDVSAGSLEIDTPAGQIGADDVKFGASGLSSSKATLGLPDALGGGEASFSNVGIDAQGHVRGTLDGGTVKIGDLTAEVAGAKVTDTGFTVDDARLILPKYLGDAKLHAKNLTWDGQSFTVDQADGDLDFALAGGKLRVRSHVDFQLLPNGGYEIGGNGHVVVPQGGKPFFEADAELRVKSLDCDPAPGACRNAAYLQRAALGLKVDRPIPLGTTGLALKGLHGDVQTTQTNPRRDNQGNVQGVVYTFGLGADIATFPNDAVFDGKIDGSISTNGNFGLSLDGTTLKFIQLHGGMCVLLDSIDTVCGSHLSPEHRDQVAGTGAYVDAKASAGATYSGSLGTLSAQLEASAFGRFVRSGGENYVDASLQGSFTATSSSWVLPDVEASGTITAQLGRFRTPSGGAALGVKGTVEARLKAAGIGDGAALTQKRAVFIDQDGKYTEENVDGYTLASPSPVAGKIVARSAVRAAAADGRYDFELRPDQTQTTIVLEADDGSPTLELTTPDGVRAVLQNGSVKAADGSDPAKLKNVYSVETAVPHTVIAYLPGAQPGRWSAQVVGTAPGHYRLDVSGNKPLPRVTVAPKAERRGRVLTLRGTVQDAPRTARLSLYAGGRGCDTRGGAQLLSAGVRVRGGAWSYRLKASKLAPGHYSVHADLENGRDPMVSGCAPDAVVVKAARTKRRKHARKRPSKAPKTVAAKPTVFQRSVVRAAAKKDPKSCVDSATIPKKLPKPPVFWISATDVGAEGDLPKVEKTPNIAINDYAAVTLNDSTSPTGNARTVVNGALGPYTKKQPTALHWGLYNAAAGCKSVAKKNRQVACGKRPFRKGGKRPGPPADDKKATSCDEYPFASTREGGADAIIRGVKWAENTSQGKQLGAFLRRNATVISQLDGEYHVCVDIGTKQVGDCDRGRN